MAVTVKNTPPVSEYMQTGIRLSDLPDLERTEFMVAKGATAVPYNYKTSAGFQELTTDLVARYEENPYRILTGTYGSSSTNLYAEEVRKIVNDYYGIYHVEYYFDHYPESSAVFSGSVKPKTAQKASVHRTEAFLSNLNDIQMITWTP